MPTYYTVYKIINLVNNNIYIGFHQTNNLDDGYMGSGKLIQRAIEKYGIENFRKEIIYVFENEHDMKAKETELVTKEFCLREDTYNLCPGGHGGWGYVNYSGQNNKNKDWSKLSKKLKGRPNPHMSKMLKKRHKLGLVKYNNFTDKTHTEETKQLIGRKNSINQKGSKNSQYGTMWINNGTKNCKIKKDSDIPKGWYKGRII